jgi:hypothetical protein
MTSRAFDDHMNSLRLAAEVERLHTALAETREALAPLAAFAPCFDTGRHVNADAIVWATPTDGTDKIVLRVEDARDARAILAKHAGLVS